MPEDGCIFQSHNGNKVSFSYSADSGLRSMQMETGDKNAYLYSRIDIFLRIKESTKARPSMIAPK